MSPVVLAGYTLPLCIHATCGYVAVVCPRVLARRILDIRDAVRKCQLFRPIQGRIKKVAFNWLL